MAGNAPSARPHYFVKVMVSMSISRLVSVRIGLNPALSDSGEIAAELLLAQKVADGG